MTTIATANEAVVVFNGKPLGTLTSVTFDRRYGQEPQRTIGNINPVENVPTAADYSVSAGMLVLTEDDLVKNGLLPEDAEAILTGNTFDILAMHKTSGKVRIAAVGCSLDSDNIQISANRVISTNATFKALDIKRK